MGTVKYRIVHHNGTEVVEEIHKIVVHRFSISDSEDPDLYAAEPLYQWENTDAGKFIMEHSISQPEFHRHLDPTILGYQYAITAELEKKKLSEYYLRFKK